MSERASTLQRGLAALIKSAIVVVGVPAAVARLWLIEALPRPLFSTSSVESASFWLHAVLIAVAVLWLWASISLARSLVEVFQRPGASASNSWASRWAVGLVGLVMLASAGSALSSTIGRGPVVHSLTASAERAESHPRAGLSYRPARQPTSQAPQSATVRANECLDQMARRVLGRADAWPAIARINMDQLQDDGLRMVDPNLLVPGWCLALPAAPLASGARTEASSSTSSASMGASRLEDLAMIGLGMLAAAGLARRVTRLRRLGACLRRPGELPPRAAQDIAELDAAVRPFGEATLIDWIDSANRLLHRVCPRPEHGVGLPDIRLVRAGPEGIEFLLGEPIPQAPAPFVARGQGRWWALGPEIGAADAARLARGAGRFVPWLVPVGDDGSAAYLLALGPGRRLSLLGEEALVAAVLRSMVVSLRVLPWAEELEVSLLGIAAPDASEQSYHLEESNALALADLCSAAPGDLASRLDCTWRREPLIVIGDDTLVGQVTLHGANARAGVITAGGPGSDELHVSLGSSTLQPFGLELNAGLLGEQQLELIDRLLKYSGAAPEVLPLPHASSNSPTQGDELGARAIETRVLAGGVELSGDLSQLAPQDEVRVIELITYLALHDGRASRAATAGALFGRAAPNMASARLEHVYSAARSALGRGGDGQALLRNEGENFVLDAACTSDWSRFRALTERARASDPTTAMTTLKSALELVGDRPFSKTLVGYRWVSDGLDESIAASIVDAAHHLAVLALAGGDHVLAQWSIGKGRLLEPGSEILVRDLMALYEAVGDHAQIQQAFSELEARFGELGANEPSLETRAYYEQLQRAHEGGAGKGG